MKETEKEYL